MKLTVEKMVYGGSGLAHRPDGKAVFLPFTLPGETVEAPIVGGEDGFDQAEPDRVLEPAAERIEPRCPHFGSCGGCQYQHAAYPAQLAMKTAILQETLERAGLLSLPPIQPYGAEPWGYRNRIRLRVGLVDGELRFGYSRRGSHEMLPIRECPIAAPLLWQTACSLLALASSQPFLAGWLKKVSEVELFARGDETALQIVFFVPDERSASPKLLTAVCEQLRRESTPELVGAGIDLLSANGRRKKTLAEWGAPGLRYRAAGQEYWVSRGSFFQVNRFLVDALVERATFGRRGALAWDLYAGVGLFSKALLEHFPEVIGVETFGSDLAQVLKGRHGRAVNATTADFLREAVLQRDRPDLILMDPPRAGLGAEVCSLLARIKAPAMVSISCDPVTLARDLRMLIDSGYTIQSLDLFDLFPQTFHLETVVTLNR